MTQLNEALLKKADAAHLVKLDKVRADTTVVPANVAYPTDSGLLAKGVAKLARTVWSLKQMGFAARTCFRDRTRSVRRRAHSIGAWLRRRNDEAKTEVLAITGELADLAEASIADALVVARNAKRSLGRGGKAVSGKAVALVADIEQTAKLLEQIVAQTRTRLSGEVPDGSRRIVSLHDKDARPIAKGRSSSVTRHRSPTTPTASSWTSPCTRATRLTQDCSCRQSDGSPHCSHERRGLSPPIAATARTPSSHSR